MAATVYETLRAALLAGHPNREGMAALRFHGMAQGLAILVKATTMPVTPLPSDSRLRRGDAMFVGLLANLVLQTHAEPTHVC